MRQEERGLKSAPKRSSQPVHITFEDGLRSYLDTSHLTVLPGCAVNSNDTSGIGAVATAAKSADVVLLYLGLDGTIENEGQDRPIAVGLGLPGPSWYPWVPFRMGKRGTERVLEDARLAMGFANARAGTRVLMLVLVQASKRPCCERWRVPPARTRSWSSCWLRVVPST